MKNAHIFKATIQIKDQHRALLIIITFSIVLQIYIYIFFFTTTENEKKDQHSA